MTIFQLKQLASTSIHAATGAIRWNYDRVELIADGVVHAIGILLGIVAATVLVVLTAVYASALDIVAVSVYVAGLLSMLVLSATYNLWPVSRTKWVLRRFDHSAIYVADRRDLHALHHGNEGQRLRAGASGRGLVRRDVRHRAEARLARPIRPGCGRALSRARLERRHAL